MRATALAVDTKQAVAGSGPPPGAAVHGSEHRRTIAGPCRLDRALEAIAGKRLRARRTLRAACGNRRSGELHRTLQRRLRPDSTRQRRARSLSVAEREKRLGPDFADTHADPAIDEQATPQHRGTEDTEEICDCQNRVIGQFKSNNTFLNFGNYGDFGNFGNPLCPPFLCVEVLISLSRISTGIQTSNSTW